MLGIFKSIFNLKDDHQIDVDAFKRKKPKSTPNESLPKIEEIVELPVDINSTHLFFDLLFTRTSNKEVLNSVEQEVIESIQDMLNHDELLPQMLAQIPDSMTSLEQVLADENHDSNDLAKQIEKDPVLAAEFIRVANSPYFNISSNSISDVKSAVNRLGEKGLREILFTLSLKHLVPSQSVYFKSFGKYIWQHSVEVANYFSGLVRAYKYECNAAYLIGLTHDIGKIIVFNVVSTVLKKHHPDSDICSDFVKDYIEKNSFRLTKKLFEEWQFPSEFSNVISHLNEEVIRTDWSDISKLLYQANLYSEVMMLKTNGKVDDDTLNAILKVRNADEEVIETLRSLQSKNK